MSVYTVCSKCGDVRDSGLGITVPNTKPMMDYYLRARMAAVPDICVQCRDFSRFPIPAPPDPSTYQKLAR